MELIKSVSILYLSGKGTAMVRQRPVFDEVEEVSPIAPLAVMPTSSAAAAAVRAKGRRRRQLARMAEAGAQGGRRKKAGAGTQPRTGKQIASLTVPGGKAGHRGGTNANGAPSPADALRKYTHFTRQEVEALCNVYRRLVSAATNVTPAAPKGNPQGSAQGPGQGAIVAPVSGEGLDRLVFRELLHNTFDVVTEEVLMDRIFCAFDKGNAGVIRLQEWISGLSVFLRGTFHEKASFAFLVYDLNSDGYITREEMFHLLKNSLVRPPQDEDPDEGVRDLVELAMRKMDIDKDGKISARDFLKAVTAEPLLLEAFGQCLPTDGSCQTFLSTLL